MFPKFLDASRVRDVVADKPGFVVWYADGCTICDYTYSTAKAFDNPVMLECRGVMFDGLTGEIVSRPYHKFFNLGEIESEVDWSRPHKVLKKLDGSMIRTVRTSGGTGFRLATRAGFTEVAQQAEEFISGKSAYCEIIELLVSQRRTGIFEWCSRKNRIVIDHPEDKLILTGVRDNITGDYLKYDHMQDLCDVFGVPLVESVDVGPGNLDEVKKWEGEEGIVIRFDDGHMLKVKSESYVLRHRAKDAVHVKKNRVELCLDNKIDDTIPLLSEVDKVGLQSFRDQFWNGVEKMADHVEQLYLKHGLAIRDQKEYAVNFVQRQPQQLQSYLYQIRKGTRATEALLTSIRNNLSNLDRVEWIWESV